MPITTEILKPVIHILCGPKGSPEILKELQYGIEEEGVPYELDMGTGDAASMALKAAHQSRLEVGIGLDDQNAVLQHAKLEGHKPLFSIPVRSTPDAFRGLGSNAGRLVKRQPLKSLDGR